MTTGQLYVIEFSTGVVKVGKSNNGRSRVAKHAAEARRHGVDVAQSWVSDPHDNYGDNEHALIVWARSQKKARTHSGNEYFAGLDFDAAVAHAGQLAAVTRHGTGEWLTLEQAAERTSLTVGAIVRHIKRGTFPGEIKGAYLMVRSRDITALTSQAA